MRVKYCIHNFVFLYSKYYENLTKMTEQMLKSGFFLFRLLIGQDSGFSSKIGVIPTKSGWLDSLIMKLV